MPHPYFSHGAVVVGLLPGVFGLQAIFRPEAALRTAQFPVPAQADAQKLTRALMRLYGSRNIIVSYLLTLFWSTGDEKLLAKGFVGATAMCIADGFISRSLIGGGEWNHWSLAPVLGGIIAGLSGWFD